MIARLWKRGAEEKAGSGAAPPARYDDLRAVFINCTLKKSPEASHTDLLMDNAAAIMRRQGVAVDRLRLADRVVAPGVNPDMTEHGWERDDWPKLWETVKRAEILIVGTPIWLGQYSSVCARLIERLYAHSGQRNDRGQYVFYGKVAGCLVTGNEDGVKHVAMGVLYALQHVGYAIPPQADAGWIGEAGPGPSYGDALEDGSRAGFDNDFTRRNTTFMTWNLLHFARMLKDAGGVPAYGNQPVRWEAGERFGHPNPEYR
ncbi:flavodoxin family protein [Amphiplicatus metriothermophilus]|uniref:Multimeric flavodoxin WrbA n=1 Tax=Amphiplicatus metriothermophilus TaxID=1519374 RepID=A0A239PIS6_9PROT|nr:flavodoxin family protein [Amphiplicatus metriothermophilus]MBB5518141.1 multimeric flavodoxin WrbA [Amphiplicatus metriothermophilus]SNT67525.1 Multimeric flavodoxin WrbA [Amphiplicatus metriothermophilus]